MENILKKKRRRKKWQIIRRPQQRVCRQSSPATFFIYLKIFVNKKQIRQKSVFLFIRWNFFTVKKRKIFINFSCFLSEKNEIKKRKTSKKSNIRYANSIWITTQLALYESSRIIENLPAKTRKKIRVKFFLPPVQNVLIITASIFSCFLQLSRHACVATISIHGKTRGKSIRAVPKTRKWLRTGWRRQSNDESSTKT